MSPTRSRSRYPVTSYTYRISNFVSRGERPSPAKLAALAREGFGATINLCAETADGDVPAIAKAELTTHLQTFHIPIIDMNPPTVALVIELLDLLTRLADSGVQVYVHCEAGKARTGVMIACYRMAVMGWSVQDALTEAKNFGCSVPMQQAFIERVAAQLEAEFKARADESPLPNPAFDHYPLLRPGSVKATQQERAATLAGVAQPRS